MIPALLVALALAVPPRSVQCAQTCVRIGSYFRCVTVARPVCLKRETMCVDSATVDCVPLVVDLGTWDPIYTGYYPQPGDAPPTPPAPSGVPFLIP